MDTNPYASPQPLESTTFDPPVKGRVVMRHRAFVGPTIYFGFKPINFYRERLREQAEQFINDDLGAENVISVTEHGIPSGPFTITVWYLVREV